jgi:hypothetical protein
MGRPKAGRIGLVAPLPPVTRRPTDITGTPKRANLDGASLFYRAPRVTAPPAHLIEILWKLLFSKIQRSALQNTSDFDQLNWQSALVIFLGVARHFSFSSIFGRKADKGHS